jgi:zinc/manganese transport system ATP-binding protein
VLIARRRRDEVNGQVLLRDVTVRYGRQVALEAVSGEFPPGSLTAVVGANGAGKSTLLAAIAGTVRLSGGTIKCAAPGRLAYLPQVTAIDCEFPLTVRELIALGGWPEFGAFRALPPDIERRAAAAAETVGLTERLGRFIGELSRGELQRALFARLMLQEASIILLDEPFAAVDAQTAATLIDHLTRWHREGRTVVAVLHDLDLVRTRFPSSLVLARRCVAWGPTETALPQMAT